jgi:hypothetical protein
MSDTTPVRTAVPEGQQESQRDRLRRMGREAFVQAEMERLGFWPPSQEVAEEAARAHAQLKTLYAELTRVRTDLAEVNKQIEGVGDLPALLAEVRRKRIERVRAERAVKKEERSSARNAKREADKQWRRITLPFLGREVSAGLRYEGGDETKRNVLGLPALNTAEDVASAIGISTPELAWLAYHRTAAKMDHYNRFTIPKKRGGVRVISSPKKKLRVAQGWLLVEILDKLPVHDAAMAFRPGRSVVDNAKRHAGKPVIIKLDLEDFFPSVGVKRVKGIFESVGYNEGVATILALIATETPRVSVMLDGEKLWAAVGERALPQGACTSPALTNFLCRKLDARLAGLGAKMGFTYTRYADDLVFSTDDTNALIGPFLALVRQIVTGEGFRENQKKTQILRPHQRQIVTGLVVNQDDAGPRVSRNDVRRFRAFLHGCEAKGFEAMTQVVGRDAQSYAKGYLAFLHMARPEVAAKFAEAHPWVRT